MSAHFFLNTALLILFARLGMSQEKYREDQFYLGANYNALAKLPDGIGQNNFSYGIQAGFIRDFPINAACNKAIGLGIGYATNSYYSNLKASQTDGKTIFEAIKADEPYSRSKIETHLIELPIELRWRTSTLETHQFWRVYAGVLFSYAFVSTSKFITPSKSDVFYNPKVRKLQSSVYVVFNFKTRWNIYASYALTDLFENNTELGTTHQKLEARPIQFGFRFYFF